MAAPDLVPVTRALISVSDKTGLVDFGRALAGMGVSFLPFFAFQREAAAGTLVGVTIDDPGFASATAQVCIHAERRLTYAARQMLEALRGPLGL